MTPIGLRTEDLDRLADLVASSVEPLLAEGWAPSEPPPTGAEHPAPSGAAATDDFAPCEHEIVVRLLGSVDVVDTAGNVGVFERSKTVELIAWLATHRDRATRTAARTALWELDVRDATFANVVSEARRALARLVPPPDGGEWLARTLNEQLPLHAAVTTDADLVAERLEHARSEPPDRAVATLRPAVEMIRDLPFTGTNYLWPDAEGLTSRLVLLCTSVCAELAAHALSVGDVELVFEATDRGLRVLPGHEELIGLRMRAHARTGDLAGVRQEWESYERVLVADAWSDGEPAPKLAALRQQLLAPGRA
jgi:two-component SAPR family response regulator